MKSYEMPAPQYENDATGNTAATDLKELHTTLPLTELINLFESEIREVIIYDSFEYDHPQQAVHVFKGVQKLHKCRYRLKTSGIDLGKVTLSRREPFEEIEVVMLEKALSALSVHMKNAMDYQASLDEEQLTSFKVDAELSRIR